jgi:hypothetical protein
LERFRAEFPDRPVAKPAPVPMTDLHGEPLHESGPQRSNRFIRICLTCGPTVTRWRYAKPATTKAATTRFIVLQRPASFATNEGRARLPASTNERTKR